ncbi:glucan endo-alpha-glucosidase agn1 [Neofusicoccum parvum]|nr:glucan endo-alpha-glucosidase agn1 [Neofusicoccum parvum]
MRSPRCLAAAAAALLFADKVIAETSKAVFAHYMVGTVFEEHVKKDVDDAAAMGLDGFALNIGDPTGSETRVLLNNIFDYAAGNHPEFKLFISMDLWSPKNLSDFDQILTDFLGHTAYYKGSDGYPFLSTYGSGGFHEDLWYSWRDRWADKIYFVPDFADIMALQGTDGWWDKWGGLIAGLFSWEAAWPQRGQASTPEIAAADEKPAWTREKNKAYMMGLSMLQYKNSYGANIYRAGEENLPLRIQHILNMPDQPDFTQILTWNDGPESHYMGNIWPEQDNTTEFRRYANQTTAPHTGIQPLLTSFIAAFKAGAPAANMTPPTTSARAAGALWFKPILANTTCASERAGDLHGGKPDGYGVAVDVATWAVVVGADDADGLRVRGFSGGEAVGDVELMAGLNFGNFSGLREGPQCLEVRDGEGALVAVARGGRNVSSDCPDAIYNLNPQVLGLADDVEGGGCEEASSGDDGDDGDDESWGVRGAVVDRGVVLAGLFVALASGMGVLGLC